MSRFYQRVAATWKTQRTATGNDALLQQMLQLASQGYSWRNPGRDYLYIQFSLK